MEFTREETADILLALKSGVTDMIKNDDLVTAKRFNDLAERVIIVDPTILVDALKLDTIKAITEKMPEGEAKQSILKAMASIEEKETEYINLLNSNKPEPVSDGVVFSLRQQQFWR